MPHFDEIAEAEIRLSEAESRRRQASDRIRAVEAVGADEWHKRTLLCRVPPGSAAPTLIVLDRLHYFLVRVICSVE
jgi:hypothetical protein